MDNCISSAYSVKIVVVLRKKRNCTEPRFFLQKDENLRCITDIILVFLAGNLLDLPRTK